MRGSHQKRQCSEQDRKDGQKMVEGHPARLPEHLVFPRFADRATDDFSQSEAAKVPGSGHSAVESVMFSKRSQPSWMPSVPGRPGLPAGALPHAGPAATAEVECDCSHLAFSQPPKMGK